MTDARERRITALSTAAKATSQAKTETTEQAIRRLVKRGEPITFQAVGREAGVSHAFLYGHPNPRGRIEHLRDQHRPMPAEPTPPRTTMHRSQRHDYLREHNNFKIVALSSVDAGRRQQFGDEARSQCLRFGAEGALGLRVQRSGWLGPGRDGLPDECEELLLARWCAQAQQSRG
jgi:Family of unknown function (DUF6262)